MKWRVAHSSVFKFKTPIKSQAYYSRNEIVHHPHFNRERSDPLETNYDYIFKILIIGDSGVGKSCLLRKISDPSSTFKSSFISTIGVDFEMLTFKVNEKLVKLQIWDTAGQERFANITKSYYRGAHGVLLVYDVSDETSFEHIQTKWLNNVKDYACTNVSLLMVGNKIDLKEESHKKEGKHFVSYERALDFSNEHEIEFIEASAKSVDRIEEMFSKLMGKMIDEHRDRERVKDGEGDNKRLLSSSVPVTTSCCALI